MDKEEVPLQLAEYAEYVDRRHTTKYNIAGTTSHGRNTTRALKEFCAKSQCAFSACLNVNRLEEQWTCTAFETHTCVRVEPTIRKGRCAYQAKMLIGLFAERVRQNMSLCAKELKHVISEYVRRQPCPCFAARVRKLAVIQFLGSELQILQRLSAFISDLEAHGHKAKLITVNAEEMVEKYVDFERSLLEQQKNSFLTMFCHPSLMTTTYDRLLNKLLNWTPAMHMPLCIAPNMRKTSCHSFFPCSLLMPNIAMEVQDALCLQCTDKMQMDVKCCSESCSSPIMKRKNHGLFFSTLCDKSCAILGHKRRLSPINKKEPTLQYLLAVLACCSFFAQNIVKAISSK